MLDPFSEMRLKLHEPVRNATAVDLSPNEPTTGNPSARVILTMGIYPRNMGSNLLRVFGASVHGDQLGCYRGVGTGDRCGGMSGVTSETHRIEVQFVFEDI